MIAIGAVCSFISLILSAVTSHSLPCLFIFNGFFLGTSLGMGMPMFLSLPAQWFSKRRGLASGITTAGTGIGGGISSLIMRDLLPRVGYRSTLLVSLRTTRSQASSRSAAQARQPSHTNLALPALRYTLESALSHGFSPFNSLRSDFHPSNPVKLHERRKPGCLEGSGGGGHGTAGSPVPQSEFSATWCAFSVLLAPWRRQRGPELTSSSPSRHPTTSSPPTPLSKSHLSTPTPSYQPYHSSSATLRVDSVA